MIEQEEIAVEVRLAKPGGASQETIVTPVPPHHHVQPKTEGESSAVVQQQLQQNATPTTKDPIFPAWSYVTEDLLHKWTIKFVVFLSTRAATYPITCILGVVTLSFALAGLGLVTNFQTEFDQRAFLTPQGSLPHIHSEWIDETFQKNRVFWAALHSHSDNVLTAQAIRQAMDVMDVVYGAKDFHTVCSQSQYKDYHTNQPTCRIFTVTQFWDHNRSRLEEELRRFPTQAQQDAYVRRVVSNSTFPDGTPVLHEAILGNYQNQTLQEALHNLQEVQNGSDMFLEMLFVDVPRDHERWFISSAQALVFKIDLPDLGRDSITDDLEQQLLDGMAKLQHQYRSTDAIVQSEYFTLNAYQQEFQRAMDKDMPLVLVLIVTMVSFTCFVFYRPAKSNAPSRSILGLFSFATIGCSILSGYGIMFLAGVPLTSIGIMIPFVITGVGLDDTFIITGAYFRRLREQQQQQQSSSSSSSSSDEVVSIIQHTMEEVGASISMTTWTTLLCFLLGSISSIPAVEWLCLYAATTIFVDFIYQITLFVALLVLDERRVRANRRDCCFWLMNSRGKDDGINNKQQDIPDTESDETKPGEVGSQQPDDDKELDRNFMEVFMSWYADRLLLPWVKIVVIFVFTAFFAGCTYSTTFLYQEFNVGDYVPKDSMLTSFTIVFQEYTSIQRFIGVYFRNVDQSDPRIQDQMMQYVNELAELPQIGEPPAFFWLRDFYELSSSGQVAEIAEEAGIDFDFHKLTFNQQIGVALEYPPIRQVYAQDIVRDEKSGNITASRTFLYLREIDMKDIKNQMAMLFDQREITYAQPVNAPENLRNDELSFFTFDDFYFFWELYAITVDELIFTTVCCVAVVSFVALVFIPHWTAMAFVTPLIIMLYFMLLGTMQFCGITINSITYFIIVMAIGLLVDFLMHVLLRYFETKGTDRHAKVKETLETMGASILLGGFTTFLGVIPLAFSTTKTFMTVFISFLAMVVLGCSVGLAFLPVMLSLVGPVDAAAPSNKETKPLVPSNTERNKTLTPQTTTIGAASEASLVEVCAESSPLHGFMHIETIASGSWSLKNGESHKSTDSKDNTEEDGQPTELCNGPGSPQSPREVSKPIMVEEPKPNGDEEAERVYPLDTAPDSPNQQTTSEEEKQIDGEEIQKTLERVQEEDPKQMSSGSFPEFKEEPDFYFM